MPSPVPSKELKSTDRAEGEAADFVPGIMLDIILKPLSLKTQMPIKHKCK